MRKLAGARILSGTARVSPRLAGRPVFFRLLALLYPGHGAQLVSANPRRACGNTGHGDLQRLGYDERRHAGTFSNDAARYRQLARMRMLSGRSSSRFNPGELVAIGQGNRSVVTVSFESSKVQLPAIH